MKTTAKAPKKIKSKELDNTKIPVVTLGIEKPENQDLVRRMVEYAFQDAFRTGRLSEGFMVDTVNAAVNVVKHLEEKLGA